MTPAELKEWLEAVIPFANTVLAWASGWVGVWMIYRLLPRLWNWGCNVTPVVVDGTLYTAWAALTFLLGFFSEESVYKYFSPYFIIYSKLIFGTVAAGAGALKTFRSTSYSSHIEAEKAKEATTPEPTP